MESLQKQIVEISRRLRREERAGTTAQTLKELLSEKMYLTEEPAETKGETGMSELLNDPAVNKLLEYARKKKKITYDEVSDFLPEEIVNSDKIEDVFSLLEKHSVEIEEDNLDMNLPAPPGDAEEEIDEDGDDIEDYHADDEVAVEDDDSESNEAEEESKPKTSASKKRVVLGDKDSAVDDPIRLYLREIGKENLLTAEQEVELSKRMEEGENIIKQVVESLRINHP